MERAAFVANGRMLMQDLL